MPWDGESAADEYIDYLAEHESGFMGGLPVRPIGMDEALRRLTMSVGGSMRTIGAAPRRSSTNKGAMRLDTTMAKKTAADKKAARLAKLAAKNLKKVAVLEAKRDKKVAAVAAKFNKKIAKLQPKADKAVAKVAVAKKSVAKK
jgi:hypothetical protein